MGLSKWYSENPLILSSQVALMVMTVTVVIGGLIINQLFPNAISTPYFLIVLLVLLLIPVYIVTRTVLVIGSRFEKKRGWLDEDFNF